MAGVSGVKLVFMGQWYGGRVGRCKGEMAQLNR